MDQSNKSNLKNQPDKSVLEWACDYIGRKWSPVPLPYGKKGLKFKNWQQLRITLANVKQHFHGPQNIGIIFGPASNGLADIDLDCIEAIQLAPYLLPKTASIFGRASKPSSHWLYYLTGDIPKKASLQFRNEQRNMMVELRFGGDGKGAQSAFPGSVHQSGEPLLWVSDGDPTQIEFKLLKSAVIKIAVGVLLIRYWPPFGARHDTALVVGGFLARAGWSADDIGYLVEIVARVLGHQDPEDRRNAAVDSANNFAKGEQVYGLPMMREVFGDQVAKLLAKLVGYGRHQEQAQITGANGGLSYEDFYSHMPMPQGYWFVPAQKMWPAKSVNSKLRPVLMLDHNGEPLLDDQGNEQFMSASEWLDKNRSIEGMTWAPGEQTVIVGKLFVQPYGWVVKSGVQVFNQYRPPLLTGGDPSKAGPWVDHVRKLYGEEADRLIDRFAHRVQRPGDKINHAVVLGGATRIGKDSILAPLREAIGPWNMSDIEPKNLFEQWTPYVKSVVLRINECRDLGDVNRFTFYDHTKTYIATPPEVLLDNEKFSPQFYVPNVCLVIMTTNYRDALYLPRDDQRHYVLYSELTIKEFGSLDDYESYFKRLWHFYNEEGGYAHVAGLLTQRDLSNFNAKAPPPKTAAFWAMVNANRSSEETEVSDVIDALGNPKALTIVDLIDKSTEIDMELTGWLQDRRNRKAIPHKLDKCGYIAVDNDTAEDGSWKIGDRRRVIYARKDLAIRDQLDAARELVADNNRKLAVVLAEQRKHLRSV